MSRTLIVNGRLFTSRFGSPRTSTFTVLPASDSRKSVATQCPINHRACSTSVSSVTISGTVHARAPGG